MPRSLRSRDLSADSSSSKENHEFGTIRGKKTEKLFCSPRTPRKRVSRITDDLKSDHSPPKHKPTAIPASPGVSSAFADKLRIAASPRSAKKAPNRLQKARRALSKNEFLRLPGREQEIDNLSDVMSGLIERKASGSLYISGQPGTGKTATVMKLMDSNRFREEVKMLYINCTSIASAGSIYKRICAELELQIEKGGQTGEKGFVAAIEEDLTSRKKPLMLILDEIDQLSTKKQTVLYKIFEWPAIKGARLILIGIANALDLTDRTLARLHAKCELKPRLMHFAPYSKQQIIEIFKSRLDEAEVTDLFAPATIQLLAAKVSAVSGDIRKALDIGRRVVELAEQRRSEGVIGHQEVMNVLNSVYGSAQTLDTDLESAFPLQQKILICSLLLIIRGDRKKDITVGHLHDVYKRVCSRQNLLALDQSEFVGLCSLVETRGILKVVRKKEARFHRVSLEWDEEEVSAAMKDKQLIASILQDKSCLGK